MISTGPGQSLVSKAALQAAGDTHRPKALGPVPRLGLGSRTSVIGWPTIFRFLSKTGVFANAIQNSVARELMPLAALLSREPREETYLPGLGLVEVGHTGSTIEGLLQWGTITAEESSYSGPGYGADADHLPVYIPSGEQWQKTARLIRCSAGYSHFSLDVGFITDWDREPGKRFDAVPQAAAAAVEEIRNCRQEPFDLEICLDESPEGIPADVAATQPEETARLLDKLAEHGVRCAYVAPNLGFIKGSDVPEGEGRERFARLTVDLHNIAQAHGALLSIHSGDYLSRATRRVLRDELGGRMLFKVSPAIQDIFGDAVISNDPDLAAKWRVWTIDRFGGSDDPAQTDALFRKRAFAAFGSRNEGGAFEMRELIYDASAEARACFDERLAQYLQDLRSDVLGS